MNTNLESMDLNKFRDWQREKPEARSVDINIEPMRFNDEVRVRVSVYDYSLLVGQNVQSVEEIDLEAAREEKDRAEYEALKAKYEPAQ